MTEAADAAVLGENIVLDTAAPPPPPIDQEPDVARYIMAPGEKFTREQYLDAGWTDDQLLAHGKMTTLSPDLAKIGIELKAPMGMPNSTWIILDDNDDIPPTGLFVGHNGTGFLIQTGVPVRVPDHVLAILDDAVMDAPITDPQTKQVMGYRPRPRYSYRRVSAPVDA